MYTQRLNHKSVESSINRPFVTAILGPRRVGKTYFVQEIHYEQARIFGVPLRALRWVSFL